jgi:methyl-accepting chemotaxis protein/HAMP domain-containing protein
MLLGSSASCASSPSPSSSSSSSPASSSSDGALLLATLRGLWLFRPTGGSTTPVRRRCCAPRTGDAAVEAVADHRVPAGEVRRKLDTPASNGHGAAVLCFEEVAMKFFNDLSFRGKFWLFSGFFLLIPVVMTTLAYRSTGRLAAESREMAQLHLPAVRTMTLMDMMHDGLRAVVLDAYRAVLEKDDKGLQAAAEEQREKAALITRYINELDKMQVSNEVMEHIDGAIVDVGRYVAASQKLVELAQAKDVVALRAQMPAFQSEFERLEKSLEELGDEITAAAQAAQSHGEEAASGAMSTLMMLCAAALVAGGAASLFFIGRMGARIGALSGLVDSINREQYALRFHDDWHDELHTLGGTIVALASKIDEQLTSIQSALKDAEHAAEEAARATRSAEVEKARAVDALDEARAAQQAAAAEKERVEQALRLADEHRESAMRAQSSVASEHQKTMQLMKDQSDAAYVLREKINQILRVVDSASGGNFRDRIHVMGNEPIDNLAVQLNGLFEKMDASLSQVDRASINLTRTSEQFVTLNRTLTESARQTEHTADLALGFAVQAKSESIELTNQANEIRSSSSDIYRIAQSNAKTSVDVAEKAKATEEIMRLLAKTSRDIAGFTRIISTISSQTKLLALNATIEASRAGDAGKGFAVVANEVKDLALQTNDAAEQVEEQTAGIVRVVENVETAINQIIDGSARIREQSQAVFASVDGQSKSTEQMFALINKSIRNLDEINTNLATVKQVAQSGTASAESIQAESLEMTKLSDRLREVVSQFHTRA